MFYAIQSSACRCFRVELLACDYQGLDEHEIKTLERLVVFG